MRTVFKVVSVTSKGEMRSAIMKDMYGKAIPILTLTYKLGEVTEPFIGKVFAFDRLSAAMYFARTRVEGRTRILRCQAHGRVLKIRSMPNYSHFDSVVLFWLAGDERDNIGNVPDGTVVCEAMTPLEVWSDCR